MVNRIGALIGGRLKELQAQRKEMKLFYRALTANKLAVVGLALITILVLVGILAPLLTPKDPLKQDFAKILQPPGTEHLLGTDDLGRDMVSRIVYGARISLVAGLITVVLAVSIGVPLGVVSGFLGGKVDIAVMRIADAFFAFPAFLLALAFAAALGPGLNNAMVALALAWWPQYSRLARGSVLSVKENEYIEAARAVGESRFRMIVKHVLPNIQAPLVVKITMDIGIMILSTAGLSFIGVGAQPPTPEWGAMVTAGRHYIGIAWWMATLPGLAILIAVLGFNLLGDGIRDALDPRMRR